MNLVDELYAVTGVLGAHGVRYAVCGGVAVTAHGAPRMTKDIDLLVERREVSRILDLVRPLGYAFPALPMAFEEGTSRERHVQRVSKVEGNEHLVLDLMIVDGPLAGALDDVVEINSERGAITFVSLPTLLRLKRLAGRHQDLADIEKLEGRDGE